MTPEQQKALRAQFPESEIGQLPRATCKDCSKGNCAQHKKQKCGICHAYITTAHIHLDFVGHAELTDRLLEVDPDWTWEPMGVTPDGVPVVERHGSNLVMWGRLTLCGVTRPGVGSALAAKDDAHKELIGDFLRNAAMRFGVALDLWRKSEKAEREHVEHDDEPEAPRVFFGWQSLEEQSEAHEALRVRISASDEDTKSHMREWRKAKRLPWPMPRADLDVMAAELDSLSARHDRAVQVAEEAGLPFAEDKAMLDKLGIEPGSAEHRAVASYSESSGLTVGEVLAAVDRGDVMVQYDLDGNPSCEKVDESDVPQARADAGKRNRKANVDAARAALHGAA
jgi:hypothetical protein